MRRAQNIDGVKKVNRSLILNLLLKHKVISRTNLVEESGLNKATITNIVSEFKGMGVIQEHESFKGNNGRKINGLSLDLKDASIITIRINREEILFAICDVHADIVELEKAKINESTTIAELLDIIFNGVKKMMNKCEFNKILGISISMIGPLIIKENRTIANVYDMPEFAKVDFREELQSQFPDVKVYIEHDTNVSAINEWNDYVKETKQSKGVMLNINFEVGIGGGIVIDGALLRGSIGLAGEIGHMGINFNSKKVKNKSQGIFESYASPREILESIEERLYEFPESKITENSDLQEIYQLYDEDDPLAVWAVNKMCWYLSYGIRNLLYLINPNVIVLGDEVIRSEKFLSQLKANLYQSLPADVIDSVDLKFSKYKEDGILRGAALVVINNYIESLNIVDFINRNYAADL
ncbi:ROK family protein [Gracilibacillus phocaeensis]|uniref:ROK family protein n=1 Tax=Gracilibacillus phocaeensis TaxID=2042304 RepID=UPI001031A4F6|nr:ROK family protein [Gracilibacillus phocaeensis]